MRSLLLTLVLAAGAQTPPMGAGMPVGAVPVDEPGLLAQIQALDAELATVEAAFVASEDQVRALEASRQLHQALLADTEERLVGQRRTLARQIAAVYKASRRGLARMIFGAEDPDDLRRVITYELRLVEALNRRMLDFRATQVQRQDALDALSRDEAALTSQRAELQLKSADLKDQRSRRLELLLDIRSRRDLSTQLSGEWQQAQRSFGETLRPSTVSLNAGPVGSPASAAVTMLSDSPPPPAAAGCPDFRERHGQLPWPTSGPLLRRYGDALTGGGVAKGIAVGGALGAPVRVVCGGVVKMAAYVPGYGQTVAVEHGAYITVYSNMNGIRARKGDALSPGDVVGFVGNTGLTEGAGYQLGFELRYNGTPQDPLPWLSPP